MRAYRYHTLDVFTRQVFSGNPLAVLTDARGLGEVEMQAITKEFNLSETVFVLPPEQPAHTRRLRIFTPGGEIPFAGHPTIGTAFVLAQIGLIPLAGEQTPVVFEEPAGPVPVLITARSGARPTPLPGEQPDAAAAGGPQSARLTAPLAPVAGPPPPEAEAVAEMIGVAWKDLLIDDLWQPQAYSAGTPFLFVPVRDRGVLRRARLNYRVWENTLADFWAQDVFVLCFDPERPGSQVRARMFAPNFGIPEDPATGAAAAALGGYLGDREDAQTGEFRWVVEQGFEMGRPSLLEVTAEKVDGVVQRVHVGGEAVLVSEGLLQLPD